MSVITKKIGRLEYLTAEKITVPHCFTTRFGGVSEGYLSSLNLGIHRGDKPENIRAAIGPNIGVCCFETHADVPDAVREVLGEEAEDFIFPAGEKFRVDLKGVNAALLRRAGVRQIEISTECTACRPDRFWSHRRVGNDRGSLAAVIVCEGERTE